ncbi:hypothetical protein Tsubulata_034046 [Turnera subulata]|uniref:Pectinesterase inhibitor domain-containing protein n=1 Tax=Turnera subulata TaxID=218843 RepID=A0A9Q0F1U8_9ROSI|nr:hypothetical protein Tsubulata_034046 [Turnera subulata]
METQVVLSVLFTVLCLYSSHAILTVAASPDPTTPEANGTDYIRSSCGATLYPEVCYTSLSRYASAVQQSPGRLARLAVGVSLSKARRMAAYVSNLSREADYGADRRAAAAVHDCFSNFADAVDEITGSLKQMRRLGGGGSSSSAAAVPMTAESFQFGMSNVQTWMSAALTDEETCTDGFEDVEDGPVKAEVCNRAAVVKKFTSNALALVNTYAAKGMP